MSSEASEARVMPKTTALHPPSLVAADANAPPGKAAYMALAAALLGWMFDGAEMGVFSLVGQASSERPAANAPTMARPACGSA